MDPVYGEMTMAKSNCAVLLGAVAVLLVTSQLAFADDVVCKNPKTGNVESPRVRLRDR